MRSIKIITTSESDKPTRSYIDNIGTLREGGLHRDLKAHYAGESGRTEVAVGKYIVDVKFNDRLVEIQTANFRSIRYKLLDLLSDHAVTLVYPIAVEKWLVKKTKDGESRRKSPRTGRATDVLDELIYVPKLLNHPNLTLELVYVHIEEHREFDPKRAWRRRHWVVTRRALIAIKGSDRFQDMGALFEKFTATLNHPFTTHSIARDLRIPRSQAQRFAYCFRHAGVIGQCGKEGNAVIYQRQANSPA